MQSMHGRFALIAFDGDDTLWHNERSYRTGREMFRRLLLGAGVAIGEDELEERANQTEVRNIPYYGYGVSSFILSMIETAIDLTGGRITGGDIRELIEHGKGMLAVP
jgi:putative hydrolase of the HAD superfamily